MTQGLEARRGTAQVIPRAPEEVREQAAMPVQVKEFGLGMRVLEPHGPEPVAQRALAAPGRPKHQKVPSVAEMVDDAKERVLVRLDIEPRPAVQVGIRLWTTPGGREPR